MKSTSSDTMLLIGVVFGFALQTALGFSWPAATRPQAVSQVSLGSSSAPASPLADAFSVAIRELEELESEPLCHRIAARLLVNNCQLLDGRDEATILTETGRAARDFVDSYAASLAICDLERGSFPIPSSCVRFREPVLASLSAPTTPQLHVSTVEIDNCLEGLAQSDSAWNTWVSYRHKTLRFCEAARADNDKDRNIHLYQRITKILEKMTLDVERDMQERLKRMETVWRDTSQSLEDLGPRVDHLRDGLDHLDDGILETLSRSIEQSAKTTMTSLEDAQNLQQLLKILVQTVLDRHSEVSASYETSLEVITQPINRDVVAMVEIMAEAMTASIALANELENSRLQAAEIARKQEGIDSNFKGLEEAANELTKQHVSHHRQVEEASAMTSRLIRKLDAASSSAETIGTTLSAGLGAGHWWPYLLCPAASLVMGSYGLPPSAARNIALIGLGELAGFFVSSTGEFINNLYQHVSLSSTSKDSQGNTTSFSDDIYAAQNQHSFEDI